LSAAVYRYSGNLASSDQASGAYTEIGSANWAGYLQYTPHAKTFTAVEDTWVVPTVETSVSGDEYSADWVGIGGYKSAALLQVGTIEDNLDHHATYSAWSEILPAPAVTMSGLLISPGDRIETWIEEIATGRWQMTVVDLTTGAIGGRTVDYTSTDQSAEAILERPKVGPGLATLAKTTNLTFDPGFYSTAAPDHPAWKPLLATSPVATLFQICLTDSSGGGVIPSAPSSDREAFTIADGSSRQSPAPS
jgi:Peptidase A4 family